MGQTVLHVPRVPSYCLNFKTYVYTNTAEFPTNLLSFTHFPVSCVRQLNALEIVTEHQSIYTMCQLAVTQNFPDFCFALIKENPDYITTASSDKNHHSNNLKITFF